MVSVMAKDLRDLLECGICFKQMVTPKVLDCQHTYCDLCLSTWRLKQQDRNYISCPACRLKTPAGCLKADHKQKKLAEIVKQLEVPHCEVCAGSIRAYSYCKNCQDCLCAKCAAAHLKFPSFKTHQLSPIRHFKNDNEFCQEHQHKPKDFYCEKCDVLVCSLCAMKAHQQHLKFVRNATEYCKGYLSKVEKLVKRADSIYGFEHKVKYEDRLLSLQKYEKGIGDLKDKVKVHVKSVIKDIKVQESKLLASIDENTATLKKWQDWAEGTKALKPHAEELSKRYGTYLQTRKPADLLVNIKDLYTKVDTGVGKYAEAFPPLKDPVDFIPEQRQKLSIGKVVVIGEETASVSESSTADSCKDANLPKKRRCVNPKRKPATRKKRRLRYTRDCTHSPYLEALQYMLEFMPMQGF